jgi:hypothetical protein
MVFQIREHHEQMHCGQRFYPAYQLNNRNRGHACKVNVDMIRLTAYGKYATAERSDCEGCPIFDGFSHLGRDYLVAKFGRYDKMKLQIMDTVGGFL